MIRKTRKAPKTNNKIEATVTDFASPQRPFGRLEGELAAWCTQKADSVGNAGRAASVPWAKNHVLYDEELAATLIRRVHVHVRPSRVEARRSVAPVVAAPVAPTAVVPVAAAPVPPKPVASAAPVAQPPVAPAPAPEAVARPLPMASATPAPYRRPRTPLPFGLWITSSAVLAILRWLLPSP
jgi:hypothetical protein